MPLIKIYAAAIAFIGALLPTISTAENQSRPTPQPFYATVQFGLQYKGFDTSEAGSFDDEGLILQDYNSRFGFKFQNKMQGGALVWGKLEFQVDESTDPSSPNSDQDEPQPSVRHAVVGIDIDQQHKFYLGETHHTWYNYIVQAADRPWWGSGYAGNTQTQIAYRGRTSHGVSYNYRSNDWQFGLTGYFDESRTERGGPSSIDNPGELLDQFEMAVELHSKYAKFALGYIGTSGLSSDISTPPNSAEEDAILGISGSISANSIGLAFNYQTQSNGAGQGNNQSSFTANINLFDFYAHMENLSRDAGSEPLAFTLGYDIELGHNTLMWFELQQYIANNSQVLSNNDPQDTTYLRMALRYSF